MAKSAKVRTLKTPQDVLSYWLDDVGPKGWYEGGETLDADIRDRFESVWERAAEGSLGLWLTCASETLAYLIVTDQFSRNMFRDQAKAFSTDKIARAAAKVSINKEWDFKIDPPARQFFYMPLMHSEDIFDQDRAVRLFCSRMPDGGAGNIEHARAHREIIRRFGRFPFRNKALGRETTAEEQSFMDEGGYRTILQEVQGQAA